MKRVMCWPSASYDACQWFWLSILIAGVKYFIPFETSQRQVAEEKCKMLNDAKSEYERIVGI